MNFLLAVKKKKKTNDDVWSVERNVFKFRLMYEFSSESFVFFFFCFIFSVMNLYFFNLNLNVTNFLALLLVEAPSV